MIACSSKSAAEQKSYSILPVFEVNAKRAFTASQEQVKLNYSLVSQPILINGISFDSSSNRNQRIVYETQNFSTTQMAFNKVTIPYCENGISCFQVRSVITTKPYMCSYDPEIFHIHPLHNCAKILMINPRS